MRPEMKFNWNEISFHREKNLITLLFRVGKMRLNFVPGVVAVKRPVKICKQTRIRYRDKHAEENNTSTY